MQQPNEVSKKQYSIFLNCMTIILYNRTLYIANIMIQQILPEAGNI